MFPYIDDKNFTGSKGEKSALSFKVLVLSPFSTVRAFDVHNQYVVRHGLLFSCSFIIILVFGHPYALCCLLPIRLRHNTEFRAKQLIEQGGFACGLGTENRDEVVIEARLGNLLCYQIRG